MSTSERRDTRASASLTRGLARRAVAVVRAKALAVGARGRRTRARLRRWGAPSVGGAAAPAAATWQRAADHEPPQRRALLGSAALRTLPHHATAFSAKQSAWLTLSSPQVYGILCCMLLCTTAVCSVMMFDQSVQAFVYANPWVQVLSMVCPLVGLIPLYCYRHSHPLNLALLGIWTATLSIGVGMVCAAYPTQVVLEALVLTAAVTLGLTGYTFYATAADKEFDFMAPFLCASLFGLLAVSVIAMFFPVSSGFQLFLAFAGAVLFAAYIVWDTFALIKRFSVDEYVWASVSLFLDIIKCVHAKWNGCPLVRAEQSPVLHPQSVPALGRDPGRRKSRVRSRETAGRVAAAAPGNPAQHSPCKRRRNKQ
jgi:hypothetical protein